MDMPLPDIIEIKSLNKPVRAEIAVPGSKSITNRALVLAALAEGETVLEGALWSEDTQVMVRCLRTLGYTVEVEADPSESCNRIITVYGMGGHVPAGGVWEKPRDLFVGNAGTAARFLAAMVCLGQGVYRLQGVPRMHERPQAALFSALRQLGYRIESANEKLPALIHGGGPRPAQCEVSIAESSQFASALYLAAVQGGWDIQVMGDNAEESRYVTLTTELIRRFPRHGGRFAIEPDASSGSYFWAARFLSKAPSFNAAEAEPAVLAGSQASDIRVACWPESGWQMDAAFPQFWPLPPVLSRHRDLGDSIMTAMLLAPFSPQAVLFTDLGRLRVQECERVAAMRAELARCGARVEERGDTLKIFPSVLHGAEIETYGDHRIAMCFATLGLRVPGLKIRNPACVKKTFPNFFQVLSVPPPQGLGVVITDALTGRPLSQPELFAD